MVFSAYSKDYSRRCCGWADCVNARVFCAGGERAVCILSLALQNIESEVCCCARDCCSTMGVCLLECCAERACRNVGEHTIQCFSAGVWVLAVADDQGMAVQRARNYAAIVCACVVRLAESEG